MQDQMGNVNQDENTKKNQKKKMLEIENTISEIKYPLIQNKVLVKQRLKKPEESMQGPWDRNRRCDISIMGLLEERDQKKK